LTKLKLGPLQDDKPVKVTVDLPPTVHCDLVAYAELLGKGTGKTTEPAKLIAPMLASFMASDRGFARARREIGARNVPLRPPNSSQP
jgi:hypothetical protein